MKHDAQCIQHQNTSTQTDTVFFSCSSSFV